MEEARPLIIKYIYIAAITAVFLTYLAVPSVALGSSLLIAMFVTLLLYFAGDRLLLPRLGITATVIANFIMAALALSISNMFVRLPITTGAIFATAAVIGVVEWFYYRFARGVTVGAGGDSGDQTRTMEEGSLPANMPAEAEHNQNKPDEGQ